MFKTTISQTPFTSDVANGYFQNITGDSYMSDWSFLATLRALLAPRMGAEDRILLQFTSSNFRAEQINGIPLNDVVRAICRSLYLDSDGMFIVHNFRSTEESNLANMAAIEKGFTSAYSGYYRLDQMTAFFKKSFPVICYANPEKKSVVFFVESMDVRKMHFLQLAILPALPWFFNKEAGISEDEMSLIESLKEKTADKYENCINKLAEQYDFRTARIRQMLAGFETRFEKIECDNVRAKIEQIDAEIKRLNDTIGARYIDRNSCCVKLLGLEAKIAQGSEDSEIMEYFMCNDRLYLEYVTNAEMVFCVADDLSYYDQEMIERILSNTTSFVYTSARNSGSITPAQMGKLIKAIFLDEILHIKFCAAYRFNLNGNVSALTDHEFPAEYSHYMPNTHINQFRCMGGYERTINQLLKNNNYIGALEQCVASCKSLNWGDSTVMGRFMSSLYANNRSIIRLPDGTYVRPAAAIKWLEEQEAANEQKEQEEATNE